MMKPDTPDSTAAAIAAAVADAKADGGRFRWLLREAPETRASIAYRAKSACEFSDPVAAIDAAMRELP